MQEKVSVIVPIYKVEKYLDRCVNSIINQTYQNLEIILVDDGSPDNSGKMCDAYATKDSRIKVIHKDNGGLSSARNAGLDIFIGDYVTFIDSDDIIDVAYVEKLLRIAKDYNAQVVSCETLRFSCEEEIKKTKNADIIVYSKEESLKELFLKGYNYFIISCAKLYKREIFEELRFKEGVIHEDEFLCHYVYDKVDKFVVTNEELYFYYYNEQSITGSGFGLKKLDSLIALMDRADFYKRKYPEILQLFAPHLCYRCIRMYFDVPKDFKNRRVAQKEIKKIFKKCKKYLKGVKTPSKKRFLLFSICPKLYKKVFYVS